MTRTIRKPTIILVCILVATTCVAAALYFLPASGYRFANEGIERAEQSGAPRIPQQRDIVPAGVQQEKPAGPDESRAGRPKHADQAAVSSRDAMLAERRAVASRFGELERAAISGDLAAAQRLYGALEWCAKLDHPTHRSGQAALRKDIESENPELAMLLRDRERNLVEKCGMFTANQRQRRREFLEIAAALGDNEARMAYFFERPPKVTGDLVNTLEVVEHRKKAMRYLDEAIAASHTQALHLMYEGFSTGFFGDVDPSRAYMYLYAYSLAAPRSVVGPGATESRMSVLSRVRLQLSPAQAEEAERQAEQLVRSCCTG